MDLVDRVVPPPTTEFPTYVPPLSRDVCQEVTESEDISILVRCLGISSGLVPRNPRRDQTPTDTRGFGANMLHPFFTRESFTTDYSGLVLTPTRSHVFGPSREL